LNLNSVFEASNQSNAQNILWEQLCPQPTRYRFALL